MVLLRNSIYLLQNHITLGSQFSMVISIFKTLIPALAFPQEPKEGEMEAEEMLSNMNPHPFLPAYILEEFEFPLSIRLQAMPLFPKWHLPLKLMAVFLAVMFVYTFLRDVVQPYVSQSENDFYKIPILVLNKVLPWTSITLLALVYLPGGLAAVLQLHRGEQTSIWK